MVEVKVSAPQTIGVEIPGNVDVTALSRPEVAYAQELVEKAQSAKEAAETAQEAAETAQEAAEAAKETAEQALSGKLTHSQLLGRDDPEQHPIKSIDGLSGELLRIPAPTEALTNEELEELLK